jgi:hypothetical protein
LTWEEAENKCSLMDLDFPGSLLEMTPEDASFLLPILANDVSCQGVPSIWNNSQTFSQGTWLCGEIHTDGQEQFIACDEPRPYICKHVIHQMNEEPFPDP